MCIQVSVLVEQAKTLPLPFLAKEDKTTSVAIFIGALVSVPPVQLTRAGRTRGTTLEWDVPRGTTNLGVVQLTRVRALEVHGICIPGGAFEVRCDQGTSNSYE